MVVQVLLCVLVHRQNVEGVAVDLHIATDWHVSRGDDCVALVNILVFPAVEELAWNDTGVLLGRLVNAN
jgi:hypothetical protein